MSDSEALYAATREDDEKLYYAFGSLDYVKKVAARWAGAEALTEADTPDEIETTDQVFTHHSAFADTLKAAVDFCLSQYQILMLLSAIGSGMPQAYTKNQIIEKLAKEGEHCGEEGGANLYKLDEKLRDEMFENEKRASVLKIGSAKIGPSVFLGMVASFDALIVDIVGKLIQQNPSRFATGDKTIPISDVLTAQSIDEIIQNFVSEELFRFSRESHDFQNEYIEKRFAIKIKDSWKRYPDYIEVFERRNLVAHGEPLFNARYVGVCERVGHKGVGEQIGKPLELRTAYQQQAIYLLSEYAILLAFVLWRKHAAENESTAFETLNEAAYKLIQDGHYVLAERILKFAVNLKNPDVTEEVRKMMIVNHCSAVGAKDNQDACRKLLEAEDWSGSALQFQLSVASLKGDIDDVVKMVPLAQKVGFEMVNYRTWPVFRFIRNDERFNDALEAAYGERLREAEKILEQEDLKPEAVDTTVH